MNREEKEQVVADLSRKLEDATFAILTDYRGLTVEEITHLRSELRNVSSEYQVAKNTLLKRASEGTPFEPFQHHLAGPTAIVLNSDDPIAASKVVVKFLKTSSTFTIKAGVLQGKVLSAEEIEELSTLPGREGLLSKLLSLLTSPHVLLLNVLHAVPQKFVQVLHAIEKKKSD